MKTIILLLLVVTSMFRVDVQYTGEPLWSLWGNPNYIHYDKDAHVWINNNPARENVFRAMDAHDGKRKYTLPERVPERKEVTVTLTLFSWRAEHLNSGMPFALACSVALPNRRLRLINVEQVLNEGEYSTKTESRVWPHLGLLYVGTVAEQEGWEVTLFDELVQGPVTLDSLVEPGDIVGLSLVTTGTDRGVELARQAKNLGASYVIAGNDSAIFRADQLLGINGCPIDAVFTTNSLTPIRQFLRNVGTVPVESLAIPGVAVIPTGILRSNEHAVVLLDRKLRTQLRQQGTLDPQDVFVVPRLSLFDDAYWEQVWGNYRTIFGHKHDRPTDVRNATALFAQGCTRAATTDVCSYCTIAGVADVRLPTMDYLEQLVDTYRSFGIDYVFSTTDSLLEMRRVADMLHACGAYFPEGLMMYGRAWGLAHHPELIDQWLSLTGGRLLVNVGMDSGDERILSTGIGKASVSGSRLQENRDAIRNVAQSGAHLHYSLIFGSPGETRETCEKSLEFFDWTRATLGQQLDQCETDIFWLNHGSPASRVFREYEYATQLAALARKEISRTAWEQDFHRHRDTLVVPWECEEAWYRHFTSITIAEAQTYNAHVTAAMQTHEGAAPSRGNAFRPG